MNQTILIELSDKQIGIVRNPYERIITLYRESWDWIGLENWLSRTNIQPQCTLYTDCDSIVRLENWESDCLDLDFTIPDENALKMLDKKYSTDYKRWYGTNLKDIVSDIVKPDLDTYGYRF